MLQLLIRAIIAVVSYKVFFYALPLFLGLLNISLVGSLASLVTLAALVIAVVYTIWGKPVPIPGR